MHATGNQGILYHGTLMITNMQLAKANITVANAAATTLAIKPLLKFGYCMILKTCYKVAHFLPFSKKTQIIALPPLCFRSTY